MGGITINTTNRGKQFEQQIQKQFEAQKDLMVLRLYDVTMGYKNINNPCDFILYKYPKIILLECKAVKGHLLNFKSNISENQWDKLFEFSKIPGVEAGVLVWFYEKHKTYYISIQQLVWMQDQGKKSFDCEEDIPTVILYGQRKRVFEEYYVERFIKELINE